MKKIIMLLLALLLFCSCGVPQANQDPENSVPDAPAEEQTDEKEPAPEDEAEKLSPIESASVAKVQEMWNESLQDKWKKEGFSATPGNITLLSDGVFSYSFTIKTDSIIFSFPASGTLSYQDTENFVPEKRDDHVLATWGCDGVLENGIRYFITLGKIVFVDKEFGLVGQVLLPENSYYHMWPMSVAYSEETGYVIPVCKIPKDGSNPSGTGVIYAYDDNFKLISENGGIPVIFETFGENYLPQFCKDSYLYKFGETTYLSSTLEYNLEDNSGYLLFGKNDRFFDGDRAVAFVSGKQYDPEDPNSPFGNYAILFEGENMIDYIELEEYYPFAAEPSGIPTGETEIFDGGRKAEIFSEFYHRTILLNFKKKTVDVEYKFAEEDLSEPFDVSSDEVYSLHSASDPDGDGISYSVVLKNSKTGSMKYMFRGGNLVSCGFLKNDDIYYQTGNSLKIYSPATGEVTFDLSKKFPLNTSDRNRDYRSIIAFRRDPEKLSFMVVYWEGDAMSIYSDDESGLPVYNIGFFDESGNLLETYESKIPVSLGMYRWPQDAVIYYKEGKYTVTTLGDDNNKGINFTFDHNTGEFSEIKKNK